MRSSTLVVLFVGLVFASAAESAETKSILARIQEITQADLGESYAGPFSDMHPLEDDAGQNPAHQLRHMPTLAEALNPSETGKDEPSPFDADQQVGLVSRVVRRPASKLAKRIPVYHRVAKASMASASESPFHLALKANRKRVSIVHKMRTLTAKRSFALSRVHAALASPKGQKAPLTTKLAAAVKKVSADPEDLLKELQSGISKAKAEEKSLVKNMKVEKTSAAKTAPAKTVLDNTAAVESLKKGSSDAYKSLLDQVEAKKSNKK
jgi:hypothetical protein